MARTQDSWSKIPTELAGLVLQRLHAHVDRVRFAAVCPQWRSAARQVRLPPPLPLLALKDGDIFYSMPRGEPLHFADCKTKAGFMSTAYGNWLVYRRYCDLLLVDPFSGATMTLPAPSSVHLADEDGGDDSMDGHDSVDEGEDSEDSHDSADEGDDSEDGSAPSRVHLPDENKGDDSMAGHDSADESEDSEDSHDSADEGEDSEDGSAPSRVHLHDENKGDDSMAGHDSADECEDSEGGHDSADEGDDSEDGSVPSSVHLPNKNKGDDSRASHDSTDEGEDSEDSHDSADEGDDSEDGHGSTDKGEDSEGSHDSADEADDSEDGSVSTDGSEMLSMDVKHFEVIKLIVCSPNLIAALFKGSENNRIAVCRPGGSKWSVAWDLSLWITDMAFYQGKLYVVDYQEDLLALDISVDNKTGDPRVSRIGRVIHGFLVFDNELTLLRMLYLVESCGSLLLVRRRIFHKHVHGNGQIHTFAGQCEPDVSIFEADFGRSQWRRLTTLPDDEALFLGPCSRAVCMPQVDSPGNRVWFLDDYKDFHLWNEWPSSLSSGTSSVANPKPFSPLPTISWRGFLANSGAAWIFPAN
ncbi:uncharacterized protein LOC8066700 [Sorghum bicolor]|uniref:KIB1-4 beta-propeller domain-containing protein n=1 Tax=Sorghum bicolor TaxID=4558 RepID=C5Y5Y3_SORBI|nr:uncharacterized protein LOC8066700 [Sorghum bicolor]EES10077.1 hypothetical protein SORBI_3005G180600 [Sorghum bicolor]|eukprot:XP_002451089.1 uncharacterized protein LOC8066700 [Sorghum bicolor]